MRRTHERIKQLEVEAETLVHPQHSLAVKEEVQQSVRGFAATDPWRGEQVRRGGEPWACAGRRGCAADSSCGAHPTQGGARTTDPVNTRSAPRPMSRSTATLHRPGARPSEVRTVEEHMHRHGTPESFSRMTTLLCLVRVETSDRRQRATIMGLPANVDPPGGLNPRQELTVDAWVETIWGGHR
jgi:hypothetical protein